MSCRGEHCAPRAHDTLGAAQTWASMSWRSTSTGISGPLSQSTMNAVRADGGASAGISRAGTHTDRALTVYPHPPQPHLRMYPRTRDMSVRGATTRGEHSSTCVKDIQPSICSSVHFHISTCRQQNTASSDSGRSHKPQWVTSEC